MRYSLRTLLLVVTALGIWFGTARWFYCEGVADERWQIGNQVRGLDERAATLEKESAMHVYRVQDVQVLQIQVETLQEQVRKLEAAKEGK